MNELFRIFNHPSISKWWDFLVALVQMAVCTYKLAEKGTDRLATLSLTLCVTRDRGSVFYPSKDAGSDRGSEVWILGAALEGVGEWGSGGVGEWASCRTKASISMRRLSKLRGEESTSEGDKSQEHAGHFSPFRCYPLLWVKNLYPFRLYAFSRVTKIWENPQSWYLFETRKKINVGISDKPPSVPFFTIFIGTRVKS